ncbi:response regulator [Fulvivirga aurantia]|uniref:response regulator n=1 Tax=Fulvivirga aurantia TaxID=2529383 RepID=UPI0016285FD6|nr:response regulator [Fulvivirga aurantia]
MFYIVDDDPVFSTVFDKLLKSNRYKQVLHFDSGEACLEQLKDRVEHPSIVFLDFSLNGMNGLDVLQRIKEINKKIKVAIVTSIDDLDLRAKCLKEGAFMFINKKDIATKIPSMFEASNTSSAYSFFSRFGKIYLN